MLKDRHVIGGLPDIALQSRRSEAKSQVKRFKRIFRSVGLPTAMSKEDGHSVFHVCIMAESGTMLMKA